MKKIFLLILMAVTFAGYSQKATNYWDGSFNSYWHNANNWSLGHIPTSTEDVVIPGGVPRYPAVDIYDEEIRSLTINGGARVRIYDQTLTVIQDVISASKKTPLFQKAFHFGRSGLGCFSVSGPKND